MLIKTLYIIEFISYLSRNVSLGLRLGANILSGHMLLNILSGFTYNIMSNGFIYFFLGLNIIRLIIKVGLIVRSILKLYHQKY